MTTAKHVIETDELSGRVLGIIDAYGMAAALETSPKTASEARQLEELPKSRGKTSPRGRRVPEE